jgi:hypothetical protein
MKLPVLLIVFLFIAYSVTAQFDCNALLAKEVDQNHPEEMLKELKHFTHCGLDSIDVRYFINGPVIGAMVIKVVNAKHSCTYGDILSQIMLVTETPGYKEVKQNQKKMYAVMSMPVTETNWARNVDVLNKKFDDSDLNAMHKLFMDNASKSWTYGQLIYNYDNRKK